MPVVVALNMMDEANADGVALDAQRLGHWLGATVIPTIASKGTGIEEIASALTETTRHARRHDGNWDGLSTQTQDDVSEVEQALTKSSFADSPAACRSWALWALLSVDTEEESQNGLPNSVKRAVRDARARAAQEDRNIDLEIVGARYRWIEAAVSEVRETQRPTTRKWTDRIDAILTHRLYGLGIFAIVMAVLFEALFTWSEPLIGAIEQGTTWLQQGITAALPTGVLRDLIVDGVLAGVGNVVVFVPQIAMLFLFIAVLEDVGYLARVAFVIDRVMGRVGLHGKAFVPMLSGFACAIPAVMATRTIESRRDRLITMLTLPLMSCSARLPIYALVTAVIFSAEEKALGFLSFGAVVLFAMYSLSVLATLGAAAVLKRTVLRGPRLPLVLELPPYRVPVWRNVLVVTWRRVRKFLVDAGTIILAMTILLWALLSFPRSEEIANRYLAERTETAASILDPEQRSVRMTELSSREASEQLHHSMGGRLGRAVEPLIEPLGFDWRIGVGVVGAFAAREVFVSTLGIVFGIQDADEENVSLRTSLRTARKPDGSKLITPLTGISLMVFFVLACQCMSTIVVVRKESGTWRWPLFMFGYMSALVYVASLVVYQVGSALGWGLS